MSEKISNLYLEQIIELLPHRYPFLLIDRVLELDVGKSVKAMKNVTYNEHFFQGHFPGRPVMPGVLILEAMAQAGGILAYSSYSEEMKDRLIFFMSMDNVKFRRPVVPGDQIIFDMKLDHISARALRMSGQATVDGKVVTQAEMAAAVAPKTI